MSQRETNGVKSAKAVRSAKKKTRRHAKKALFTACASAGLWTGTSNEALGSSQATFFGSLKDVTTSTIQKWITELNSGHDTGPCIKTIKNTLDGTKDIANKPESEKKRKSTETSSEDELDEPSSKRNKEQWANAMTSGMSLDEYVASQLKGAPTPSRHQAKPVELSSQMTEQLQEMAFHGTLEDPEDYRETKRLLRSTLTTISGTSGWDSNDDTRYAAVPAEYRKIVVTALRIVLPVEPFAIIASSEMYDQNPRQIIRDVDQIIEIDGQDIDKPWVASCKSRITVMLNANNRPEETVLSWMLRMQSERQNAVEEIRQHKIELEAATLQKSLPSERDLVSRMLRPRNKSEARGHARGRRTDADFWAPYPAWMDDMSDLLEVLRKCDTMSTLAKTYAGWYRLHPNRVPSDERKPATSKMQKVAFNSFGETVTPRKFKKEPVNDSNDEQDTTKPKTGRSRPKTERQRANREDRGDGVAAQCNHEAYRNESNATRNAAGGFVCNYGEECRGRFDKKADGDNRKRKAKGQHIRIVTDDGSSKDIEYCPTLQATGSCTDPKCLFTSLHEQTKAKQQKKKRKKSTLSNDDAVRLVELVQGLRGTTPTPAAPSSNVVEDRNTAFLRQLQEKLGNN